MDFQAPELIHQANPQTDVYLKYYQAQVGGTLPVFRGAKYYSQSGAGIGDFFRGVFRHVVPIALQGVSAFLGQTLKSRDTGANWKESLKSAIAPTTRNVLENATSAITEKLSQKGSGRRNKRRTSNRKGKAGGGGRKGRSARSATPNQRGSMFGGGRRKKKRSRRKGLRGKRKSVRISGTSYKRRTIPDITKANNLFSGIKYNF